MTETRRRFILYSNLVLASLVRGITWQVASIYTQQNRTNLRQVEFSSSSLSRARTHLIMYSASIHLFEIHLTLFSRIFFSRRNLSKNNTNPSCFVVTHWQTSEKSPFNGLWCELCASRAHVARKKTNLTNCIQINHNILSFQTSFLFIFFINMSFSHFLMS